jgi:hypothetical protein
MDWIAADVHPSELAEGKDCRWTISRTSHAATALWHWDRQAEWLVLSTQKAIEFLDVPFEIARYDALS